MMAINMLFSLQSITIGFRDNYDFIRNEWRNHFMTFALQPYHLKITILNYNYRNCLRLSSWEYIVCLFVGGFIRCILFVWLGLLINEVFQMFDGWYYFIVMLLRILCHLCDQFITIKSEETIGLVFLQM